MHILYLLNIFFKYFVFFFLSLILLNLNWNRRGWLVISRNGREISNQLRDNNNSRPDEKITNAPQRDYYLSPI
jgi:hypothetical protein